jgi:hypothetical protein
VQLLGLQEVWPDIPVRAAGLLSTRCRRRRYSGQGYLFNQRAIKPPVCGVETYFYRERPDGAERVAVDARCIDDIDPAQLTSAPYGGASKEH